MDQHAPPDDAPSLTLRQHSVLPAIVASTSLAEASRRSRVSLSTLKRWMKDPAFVYELGLLNHAAIDIAQGQLQGLMLRAVANLDRDIDNPNANIRHSAIRMTLHYATKLSDLNMSRRQGSQGTPNPHALDAPNDHAIDYQRSTHPALPSAQPKLNDPIWPDLARKKGQAPLLDCPP